MANFKERLITISLLVLIGVLNQLRGGPTFDGALTNHSEHANANANANINATEVNTDEEQDGCDLVGGTPTYSLYTESDYQIFQQIQQCNPHIYRKLQIRENQTILQCINDVRADSMPSIITQYDRIWFIGDSILQQQFWNLICMLSPTLNRAEHVNCTAETNDSNCFTTYNGTLIRYSSFGWKFDLHEQVLYDGAFPTAIRTYTARDAIIVNAGAHYDGTRSGILSDAAQFISHMSLTSSNASIFFVENTDEQWPTTNGMFTVSCNFQCHCEALTPDRILGVGQAHDSSPNQINMWNDKAKGKNYMSFFNTTFATNASCIPDCLPATWRNDLVNPILRKGKVHIVPVWRQLVAQGIVHSKLPLNGDCTHKSLDALIMMNYQLGRTMLRALSDRNH